MVKRILVNVSGIRLTSEEKKNLKTYQPLGVVLFVENINNCEQVKELIRDIREALDHDFVHIAINPWDDQNIISRLDASTNNVNAFKKHNDMLKRISNKDKQTVTCGELYEQSEKIADIISDFGINMVYGLNGDICHDTCNDKLQSVDPADCNAWHVVDSKDLTNPVDPADSNAWHVVDSKNSKDLTNPVDPEDSNAWYVLKHKDSKNSVSSLDSKDCCNWQVVDYMDFASNFTVSGDSNANDVIWKCEIIEKAMKRKGIVCVIENIPGAGWAADKFVISDDNYIKFGCRTIYHNKNALKPDISVFKKDIASYAIVADVCYTAFESDEERKSGGALAYMSPDTINFIRQETHSRILIFFNSLDRSSVNNIFDFLKETFKSGVDMCFFIDRDSKNFSLFNFVIESENKSMLDSEILEADDALLNRISSVMISSKQSSDVNKEGEAVLSISREEMLTEILTEVSTVVNSTECSLLHDNIVTKQ